MPEGDVHALLDRAISAHGGEGLWRSLSGLEVQLSASGFLFAAKGRPELRHMRMWASATEPRFVFHDYQQPGWRGEWIGDAEVRIIDADGKVVSRRERPREAFRGLRRQFRWDALDFLYFGGYATWNYLTTPFLFLRPGFEFERLPPLEGPKGKVERIAAVFPSGIPTHSRRQVFWFDEQGLLTRLDYTAEVVGGWAHAAHLCAAYRNFDGLVAPTRRRVWPILFGEKPMPFPNLVALDIDEIRPVRT
jgi:hypothetical protein